MLICTLHIGSNELDMWRIQAWELAADMIGHSRRQGIIITDVDGTVLDNGPYDKGLTDSGQEWPAGWDLYVRSANPKAIPGAVRALSMYADRHCIWYVSSRREEQAQDTARQIEGAGLPMGSVICCESQIRKRSYVSDLLNGTMRSPVIQIGDQIGDTQLCDDVPVVLIPNPVYGSWSR